MAHNIRGVRRSSISVRMATQPKVLGYKLIQLEGNLFRNIHSSTS